MAIDAKISLMRDVEAMLSTQITVADALKVMKVMADAVEGYDITEKQRNGNEVDDLLDCYLSALNVAGRSPKTVERYRYIITRVMDCLKVPTRHVTVYHLRSYLAAEKARGISDSTLDGVRQVLSAYFNWLQRETLIDKNPTANLCAIKCPKKQKKVFDATDIELMKQACVCVRDRAILCFLAATGCRISEVTQLNRDGVKLDQLECTVRGKGDKERVVYMDTVAAMTLRKYLAERTDNNPALFVGKGNRRLLPGGVRKILQGVQMVSGVDHVHPHKFRRTFATNMARRGMPIQEIAHIMGHDKITTTMQYVLINREDVKHDYSKYA